MVGGGGGSGDRLVEGGNTGSSISRYGHINIYISDLSITFEVVV